MQHRGNKRANQHSAAGNDTNNPNDFSDETILRAPGPSNDPTDSANIYSDLAYWQTKVSHPHSSAFSAKRDATDFCAIRSFVCSITSDFDLKSPFDCRHLIFKMK